jgi:hypothetical protein
VALADSALLADILCIEEERVVARDNTIAHEGRRLQLPQSPLRAHYVKARVENHAGASTASKPAVSIATRSGQMMCYENRTT